MGENTLDNRGQWTGKMDCVAPRRGPMPRRDDANGGGDTTGDDAGPTKRTKKISIFPIPPPKLTFFFRIQSPRQVLQKKNKNISIFPIPNPY
jgi:hypothetical protein